MNAGDGHQPVFYYELGDPASYLVAEQIMGELPVVPEWEPVLASALGIRTPKPDRERLAATIDELGLLTLQLPARWPPDSELATLVATFAKRSGKGVAFSLAAFRQAFAGGRDLGDEGTVLIAAAACELHPRAVLTGARMRATRAALDAACERAATAAVTALPAITIAGHAHCGANALPGAGRALDGLARR